MLKSIIMLIILVCCISPAYAANTESDEFVYNGIVFSGGCKVLTQSAENEESKVKFGIAGSFDRDLKKLVVYDESGSVKNYTFDDGTVTDGISVVLSEELSADNIHKRVIEYRTLENESRITDIKLAECTKSNGYELYDEKTKSVGNIVMGEDTKVVDAIDFYSSYKEPSFKDLIMTTTDGFVDGAECMVYAYSEKNEHGAYPYVMVTFSGSCDICETGFAVIAETAWESEDGIGYALPVFYGGEEYSEERALIVNRDALIYGKDDVMYLAEGDVIMYLVNHSGRIKQIDVLLSADEIGIDGSYTQALENAFSGNVVPKIPKDTVNWTNTWTNDDSGTINREKEVTRILYGPIVKVDTGHSFKLGSVGIADNEEIYTPGNGKAVLYNGRFTDLLKENGAGIAVDVEFDINTNVYVYDFSETKRKIEIGSIGDIKSSLQEAYYCNDSSYIAWDGFYDEINGEIKAENIGYPSFALVKLDDEYATDVFVILAD